MSIVLCAEAEHSLGAIEYCIHGLLVFAATLALALQAHSIRVGVVAPPKTSKIFSERSVHAVAHAYGFQLLRGRDDCSRSAHDVMVSSDVRVKVHAKATQQSELHYNVVLDPSPLAFLQQIPDTLRLVVATNTSRPIVVYVAMLAKIGIGSPVAWWRAMPSIVGRS